LHPISVPDRKGRTTFRGSWSLFTTGLKTLLASLGRGGDGDTQQKSGEEGRTQPGLRHGGGWHLIAVGETIERGEEATGEVRHFAALRRVPKPRKGCSLPPPPWADPSSHLLYKDRSIHPLPASFSSALPIAACHQYVDSHIMGLDIMLLLAFGASKGRVAVSALSSGRACPKAFITSVQGANVRRFHSALCEQQFIPRPCFGSPHRRFGLYGIVRCDSKCPTPTGRICRPPQRRPQ
jgi:hypothetical protein